MISFSNIYSVNTVCDEIPPLNEKIIEFVTSKMNEKVGRGECWDIANEALTLVKAKWDGKLQFGIKVDFNRECVYPGDIIQFEKVKIKYPENGEIIIESMQHHTAIIYKVNGKGDYLLAHQNTAYTGKKLGTSKLNMKNVISGKVVIYRAFN